MRGSLKLLSISLLVMAMFLAGCSNPSSSTQSESYPEKPIKLIVPWGAGGDTDVISRTAAKYLEKELDAEIVIQNIGGGGGSIGAKQGMNSEADGYTLIAGHDSIGISSLMGKADFDYFDLQPVSLLTTANQLIATNVNNPWSNVEDAVKDLKSNPESISFGATIGSTTHLVPLKIMDQTNVKFNVVGYEGTAQRTQALLGNHLDLGPTTIPAAKEYLKAGKLKMLGIAAEERNPALPDVPTLKEQGIDVVNATNRGFFFPKGTPEDVVKKVSDALKRVSENPEFVKEIEEMGVKVNYKGSEEYASFLKEDLEYLEGVLKRQGVIE